MKKDNHKELGECLRECESFDEFCEKCNKLINDQDEFTAHELWEEYWSKYKDD